MNINALRWKGRIGGLKSVSMILLLFLVFIACASAISLNTALRNPDGPQPVTIEALVNDEVGTGRHVSVTGLAVYDIGYEQTEDGKTTSTYYFVVDVETGNMVLVKHSSALLVAKKNGVATITGMTRSMPTDLKDAVKEDGPLITKNGLRTTTKLYVADGAVPPSTGANAVFFVVSVIVGAVCCIPFFFPSKVFAPLPLDITATRAEGRPAVKATGTFVQIKSIDPLDIGKRTQKFTNAVANVIPRGEHDLMIYIHHVMTTKTYGITVRKTKTCLLYTSPSPRDRS